MSDNKLTTEQVDQQIAARVEQLKSQAVTPTVEPVDEEVARREEEERLARLPFCQFRSVW